MEYFSLVDSVRWCLLRLLHAFFEGGGLGLGLDDSGSELSGLLSSLSPLSPAWEVLAPKDVRKKRMIQFLYSAPFTKT
jgi:hypothetical protein